MNSSPSVYFTRCSFQNPELTLSEQEQNNCREIVNTLLPLTEKIVHNQSLAEEKNQKKTYAIIFYEAESWRRVERLFNKITFLNITEQKKWALGWTSTINKIRNRFNFFKQIVKTRKKAYKHYQLLIQEREILESSQKIIMATSNEEKSSKRLSEILSPQLIQHQVEEINNKINESVEKMNLLLDEGKKTLSDVMILSAELSADLDSDSTKQFGKLDEFRKVINFLEQHWVQLTAFVNSQMISLDDRGTFVQVVEATKELTDNKYARCLQLFDSYRAIFIIKGTGWKENHHFNMLGTTLLLLEKFVIEKIIPKKNLPAVLAPELMMNQMIIDQNKEEPKSSNDPKLDTMTYLAIQKINKTLQKKRDSLTTQQRVESSDMQPFFNLLLDRYTKSTLTQPSLTVKSPFPEGSSGNPHSSDLSSLREDLNGFYHYIFNSLDKVQFSTVDSPTANTINPLRSYAIIFRQNESWGKLEKMFNKFALDSSLTQREWAAKWREIISVIRQLDNQLKDGKSLYEKTQHKLNARQNKYNLKQEKMAMSCDSSNIPLDELQIEIQHKELKIKKLGIHIEFLRNRLILLEEQQFFIEEQLKQNLNKIKQLAQNENKRLTALEYSDLMIDEKHEKQNRKYQKIMDFLLNNWDLLTVFVSWPHISLDARGLTCHIEDTSEREINVTDRMPNRSIRAIFDARELYIEDIKDISASRINVTDHLTTNRSIRAIFTVKENAWEKNPDSYAGNTQMIKTLTLAEKYYSSIPLAFTPPKENFSSEFKSRSKFIKQVRACYFPELQEEQASDTPIKEEKPENFDLLNEITTRAINNINLNLLTQKITQAIDNISQNTKDALEKNVNDGPQTETSKPLSMWQIMRNLLPV